MGHMTHMGHIQRCLTGSGCSSVCGDSTMQVSHICHMSFIICPICDPCSCSSVRTDSPCNYFLMYFLKKSNSSVRTDSLRCRCCYCVANIDIYMHLHIMYVCIYIYIYIHTHVHIHIYKHIMYVCVYVCMYISMLYTYVCIYLCYIRMYVYIYVYIQFVKIKNKKYIINKKQEYHK
jgi:hypothetical protein